jgi:hypothetical protein
MIEIDRWIRLKPEDLCTVEPTDADGGGVFVNFKRFSVENGKELPPERSFLTFKDLEEKLAEIERQAPILKEFLGLKPKV